MIKVIDNPVILVLYTLPTFFLFSFLQEQSFYLESKIFELDGQRVKVTHTVDLVFYGKYQGEKEGYLLLNEDGTGEYLYDLDIPAKNCSSGIITLEWGLILDENEQIVRFERDYGFSYPVIFKCTGNNCFQGCKKSYFVDYILDKKSTILEVSSSDDWIKPKYE